MVQIIDDPYAGSIFGRLGANLGKGIGEELPKAVQRNVAASTLKRLGNQSDLNPLEQVSELIGRGQMSTQEASQLLPFLQNAQKMQALNQRVQGAPSQATSPVDQTQQTEKSPSRPQDSVSSKDRIRAANKALLREPSQADIDRKANELIQNKSAFSVDEARNMAKEMFKETQSSQQQNISDFEKALNARSARVLQGSGLNDYKDVEGRITQNQIDLGKADVAEGETPAVVEKDRGDILEKLGRAATQIKKEANKSLFTTKPSAKIKEWKKQKKIFDEHGYSNEFVDLVAGHQGITQMEAAHAVDPIKNEALAKELKSLNSFLNKIKTRNPLKEINQLNDKYINRVISNIKPGDNLLDVAYHFRKSGLDVHQLFESIKEADSKKPFLTDEQAYQLDQPIKNDFYGDILFEARL